MFQFQDMISLNFSDYTESYPSGFHLQWEDEDTNIMILHDLILVKRAKTTYEIRYRKGRKLFLLKIKYN